MRIPAAIHRVSFLLLSGAIVAISSERMFWYWTPSLLGHWETAVVYAIPMAATFLIIDRYQVNSAWSLVLAAPILAYLVEGVLTPVVYTGGPFVPILPAWFTFWHGFIGLVGLWYLLHLWLVQGRVGAIALASAGLGLFWGLWSTTLWLPESFEDVEMVADLGGPLQVLDPGEFARYAVTFSVLLAIAHWLWGAVIRAHPIGSLTWAVQSRRARQIYAVGIAVVLIAWTIVIPWALPMFGAYVAVQVWLLRRHSHAAVGPSLSQRLEGRVRVVHLGALFPLPVVAATTYATAWRLDPADELIRAFLITVVFAQATAAVVLVVAASWRVGGRRLSLGPRPAVRQEATVD